MDLHVEKQCIDQMKGDDAKKFLILFDEYFSIVYKYVYRRVVDPVEVERIVRLTFLDGLGKIQSTPGEMSYVVWLFSLAKPRTWNFINKASFPAKQGLISAKKGVVDSDNVVSRAEKMFGKLSMEEREIMRLKFFEDLADGEVLNILGGEESVIGAKIYRVLKRAHFSLFGESDHRQGIYFGELSGFLERVKELESIEAPEAFKISFKSELLNRIEKKEFAIEGEEVREKPKTPWKEVREKKNVGSNDPAKIFVEAAKALKDDEKYEQIKTTMRVEKTEQVLGFFDRWRFLLALIPGVVFLSVCFVVIVNVYDYFGKVERGVYTVCDVEISFDGELTKGKMKELNKDVSDKICVAYENIEGLQMRTFDDEIEVDVDLDGRDLEYSFSKYQDIWLMQSYAKIVDSNEKQRKVRRNS